MTKQEIQFYIINKYFKNKFKHLKISVVGSYNRSDFWISYTEPGGSQDLFAVEDRFLSINGVKAALTLKRGIYLSNE